MSELATPKGRAAHAIMHTMKITYDKTVDALNISLRTGKVAKTAEIGSEILADVDKNGRTLSLEIIGVKEKLGKNGLDSVVIGNRSVPLPAFTS